MIIILGKKYGNGGIGAERSRKKTGQGLEEREREKKGEGKSVYEDEAAMSRQE